MVRSVVLGFFRKVNSTVQHMPPNTTRASIHRDPERKRPPTESEKDRFLKYLLVPGRSLIPSKNPTSSQVECYGCQTK